MPTTLGVALLIDPDADTRTMNAVALEKQAFLVLEAETGEDALKLATATIPSVVVMDWRLAGPVTGEGLRHHFRTRGVPVIGLTSLDLDDAYLWRRRDGCVMLLPKAIAPRTLAAIVSCVSGARESGTASVCRPVVQYCPVCHVRMILQWEGAGARIYACPKCESYLAADKDTPTAAPPDGCDQPRERLALGFQMTKRDGDRTITAHCDVWSHPVGWLVHLWMDGRAITVETVVRCPDRLTSLIEAWKAVLQNTGWTESAMAR